MDNKILNYLEAICAKREYCSSDIRQKAFKKTEGDAAMADELVRRLTEEGFVDDLRYASAFAREKSALTGWGPVKIRFALKAKKIDSQIIDSALQKIDSQRASSKLERILEAKAGSLEGDPQKKYKLIRFALSRGYEYSDVESAVNRVLDGGPER